MKSLILALALIVLLSTTAYAATRTVSPDGWGNYPTIQSAIDASAALGDTILLMQGTFTGPGNRDINYGGKAVTIAPFGGLGTQVIIDCQGTKSNPHRGFNFDSSEGANSVLEGVEIINGRDKGQFGGCGGAIRIIDAGPTIRNCTFRDNQVWGYGGAVYIGGGDPVLIGCRFLNNRASTWQMCCDDPTMTNGCGGGLYAGNSQLSLIRCTFRSNEADDGGGMRSDWGVPSLDRCTFQSNHASVAGGGYFCFDSDNTVDVASCTFVGNMAPLGGGVYCCMGTQLSPAFTNCVFNSNSAMNDGGAVYCGETNSGAGAHPHFESCTFYFNSVGGNGGSFYITANSTAILDRTIINQSGGVAIFCEQGIVTPPTLTCCDLQGNTQGDWVGCIAGQDSLGGNFSADPMFCDAPNWDFTIDWRSPCSPIYSPEGCGLVGAKPVGCGPGLFLPGGGLIAHHPADAIYVAGLDWCQEFADNFAISSCEEQFNRIDAGPLAEEEPTVWYVLAAWDDERQFCATSFGLGDYDPEGFIILEHGPCYPGGGLDLPTAGWPGPNTGITLMTEPGTSWVGNYAPVYYFAGYAASDTQIPIIENPDNGIAGWWNCEDPPQSWQAECMGAMGIFVDGQYCCPPEGEPEPQPAACCLEDGGCVTVYEETCDELGGVWQADASSCDLAYCPAPLAACCLDEECTVVTAEECEQLEGEWHSASETCDPSPCAPPVDWANHDVGNCVLTVTDQGIIGFMSAAQEEGAGFVFPADGENLLFVGSLWVGESPSYVANRDYDADPEKEWVVADYPDGHILVRERGVSDQEIEAGFTDQGASSPLDIRVRQESWAFQDNPDHEFIIMIYEITNDGEETLNDLYAGSFLDLDIGQAIDNTAGTDLERELAYVTDGSPRIAGVRYLRCPNAPSLSNLTIIDNETYVWPNEYILDPDKHGFLSGSSPEYVVHDAPTPADYSVLAAAGPISLMPDETTEVAFALICGATLEELQASSERAQVIYAAERCILTDADPLSHEVLITQLLGARPNPSGGPMMIDFQLAQAGAARISIHDVLGRRIRLLTEATYPGGTHAIHWDGRSDSGSRASSGIYFIRMHVSGRDNSRRIVLLR